MQFAQNSSRISFNKNWQSNLKNLTEKNKHVKEILNKNFVLLKLESSLTSEGGLALHP